MENDEVKQLNNVITKDKEKLLKMLNPNYDSTYEVKPRIDYINNKVYWETKPYIRNGEVVIKRVAEAKIIIEKAFNTIEEYDLTTKVPDDKA